MKEIAYLKQEKLIKEMPLELQKTILKIIEILDLEYGANRNKYKDDGGYVIIVERNEDFEELKNKRNIECNRIIPEYVDKIVCSNGKVYTSSLVLCNNDYGITLIAPLELTPQNLKDYMID